MNLAVKDNLTARLSHAFYDYKEVPHIYDLKESGSKFYSNLSLWNECSKSDANDKENNLSFRRLILDFLYDLEHSRVFYASPHIEEIEVRLRENFFFSAIAAKTAYYFYREHYLKTDDHEEALLFGYNLKESEITWLNILRDERATETFWHEDWLNEVEDEYKNVMFDEIFNRSDWREDINPNGCDEKNDKQNIRVLRETARWFLRRYDIFSGVKAIFQYKEYRKKWIIPLFILSFIFFPMLMMNFIDEPKEIGALTVNAVVYTLAGFIPFLLLLLGFLYQKMFLPVASAMLPRLMMATASAWLLFTTTEELWKMSFDMKIFENNWVIVLLVPVILFMSIEIKNQAPDIKLRDVLLRIGYIISIGFIYSILIGMFFIHFTGEKMLNRSGYFEEFYASSDLNTSFQPSSTLFCAFRDDSSKVIANGYKWLSDVKYELNGYPMQLKYDIPVFFWREGEKATMSFLPGLLLFRSIFALFIGIFVQLIFEDKPITEPL